MKSTPALLSEDAIRDLFKSKNEKHPQPGWMADWKHVERSTFVQCIGDIRSVMAQRKPEPKDSDPDMVLLRTSKSLVLGVDLGDEFRCLSIGRADNEKDAEKLLQAARGLMKKAQERLKELKEEKPEDKAEVLVRRLYNELLANYELKREGTTVRLRNAARVGCAELFGAVLTAHPLFKMP